METLGTFMFFIICGHRFWFADAEPRFTAWPNGKSTIYKKVGETATFEWDFFQDGIQFLFGTVKRSGVTIAQLPQSGAGVIIEPSYSSRASLTATDRSSTSFTVRFELKELKRGDDGAYECELHLIGKAVKDSAQLVVVVLPTITYKDPSGSEITVMEGVAQTLRCAADGNPKPTIEWSKYNSIVETNKNVTLNPIARQHDGVYKCKAIVIADRTYEEFYTIRVIVQYKPYIPLERQLSNITVNEGNSISFFCEAIGNPNVGITYNWYKNTVNLVSSGNYEITHGGKALRVKSAQKEDIGQYKCTGTNSIGEGDGSTGYLSVKYKPTLVVLAPYPDVTKEKTESVTLTCQADGVPPPSYRWEFEGQVISGQTAKTLALSNLQKSNIGNYSCVATNEIGSTKNHTMIFVRYKPTTANLTTGTVNNAVVQGSRASLVCLSDGYPEPTYTFKKGNNQLADSSSKIHTISGNIALSHEGEYSCTPRNSKGEGPTVTMKLTVQVKPVLMNSIQPITKTEKENFTYTCTVHGKPAPAIAWYKDRIRVLESSIYSLAETVGGTNTPKVLKTEGNLIMTGITWRQQGTYSCNASNPAGEESMAAVLTVLHRPVVKYAADHPKNQTILVNEDATFSCKMIGNPKLDGYLWQVNGKNVTDFVTELDTSRLTVRNAQANNVGTYSCLGYNSLGIGPPASAYLQIKRRPVIVEWKDDYKLIVNETYPATMVCKANGVPPPSFSWTKGESKSEIMIGSTLHIANTSFSDTGIYKCTATNEMGKDTKARQLIVQVKPDITTTAPLETNIPRDATTNKATLVCSARTVPDAAMEWRKDGKVLASGQDYDITKAQSVAKSSITVELKNIKTIGEKFTCWAKNLLGTDEQIFVIREKGTPDEPIDLQATGKPAENAGSVELNFTWTPGYGGGVEQSFIAFYRKEGNSESEISVPVDCDKPRLCILSLENLEPKTTYEFFVQAKNQFGLGKTSSTLQYKTPASTQRGTVKAVRIGKGTEVVLSWIFTDERVTRVNIFYRELGTGNWIEWEKDVRTMNNTVSGLELKTAYEFRVEMLYEKEVSGVGVVVKVPAGPVPGPRGSQGLSETHIIAIAVACAGVLFIALVILALCLCKKRKKPYGRDDRVEMSQTRTPPFTSYAAGGPDIVSAGERNRQSYGTETLEDDPFVEAHLDALRKKKPDPSVNYGYASQDSFQQREMLLEPGSRRPRNDRMTRSMDNLDPSHDYPSRGPQRDFNTLPPYHEPPSFEEAMRQSGKKAKNRVRSTGDILDEGRPRQSSHRPRHAHSPDDQTDSSESENRYHRRPPPGRKMKPRDSDDDAGYASVDPITGGAALVPRHPAPSPPQNALDRRRNGPPDPNSPYATPQKRNKFKKPRQTDSSEPLMGPPPQYTPQDRMSMPELDELHRNASPGPQHPWNRPRPIAANDLEIDDQDQPDPDLPPAMPVFPATRSYPSLHDPNDGLPEPPAFLRDVLDEQRGMRSSRGRESGFATEPRQPARKPYINIHGQLVRPGSPAGSTRSSRSDGLDRLDPMRSSNNALQPEPEVPPAQRHQPPTDNDDQQAEMNYVSYLV